MSTNPIRDMQHLLGDLRATGEQYSGKGLYMFIVSTFMYL